LSYFISISCDFACADRFAPLTRDWILCESRQNLARALEAYFTPRLRVSQRNRGLSPPRLATRAASCGRLLRFGLC
jgi:hypothetical protein